MLKDSFGLEIPNGVDLAVHDSTADCRYLVLPSRPKATDGWSEEQLVGIVNRDSLIGVSIIKT